MEEIVPIITTDFPIKPKNGDIVFLNKTFYVYENSWMDINKWQQNNEIKKQRKLKWKKY